MPNPLIPSPGADKMPPIKYSLLFVGFVVIGYNFVYKYERYFLGEQLVERQIIIDQRPTYIYKTKGTSRYSFTAKDYLCTFWISRGALQVIMENSNVRSKLDSINTGDTVVIKTRLTDELFLQQVGSNPRVIEFNFAQQTLFSASEVERKDRKWYNINISIGISSLLLSLLLFGRDFRRNRAAKLSQTHSV